MAEKDDLDYPRVMVFDISFLGVQMSVAHESLSPAPLVGAPQEIRNQLEKSKAQKVIVLSVDDVDLKGTDILADHLQSLVTFLRSEQLEQNQQAFKTLVNVFLPKVPPPPNLIREAKMAGRARHAVLKGADWLTAAQLAEIAGLSTSNPSTQPNKWKRQKQIFAIHHNGTDYFPGYALDPATGYRPYKSLKSILEVFGDEKDGWGLAFWFLANNSFLGGHKPQDLLATDPERVLAAAKDEMEPVAHA